MIGFYDYTVILTYLSLMSGTIGIMLCLNGMGHPYLGMFFLLFSGLCDTFDGKVARSKKDRTTQMKKFGIQIDSLSDLIAFGMLPACIGIAMLRYTMCIPDLSGVTRYLLTHYTLQTQIVLSLIAVLYVLAAMIRLAYFNVMEEEDRNRDETVSQNLYRLTSNVCSINFSSSTAYTYAYSCRPDIFVFWSYVDYRRPVYFKNTD